MFNKIYDNTKAFIKENFKFLLTLVLLIFLFRFELPYKIFRPGGIVDLSKRVEVSSGYETDGTLGMAYVTVMRGNIPFLLASYLIPNWDIYSDDEVLNTDESWEETIKSDQILMQQSIDNAVIASYNLAGKDLKITKENANVTYISPSAQSDIMLFDVILEADGQKISSLEDLRKITNSHNIGDELTFKVLRDEKELTCHAKVIDEDGPKIGVAITSTYEYDESPKANIKVTKSESGPSGGLMMSLAIYNALTSDDITKGRKIIGTGTISSDGVVGEIGGVKYKLLGAASKKCDIFLVPKENLEEALKVKEDNSLNIEVYGVGSLKEAIEVLKK